MEARASWSGNVHELGHWMRERVLQPRIALLWLAVLGASLAAGAEGPPAWTAVVSAWLVVQFRLWDDLEDVPYDSVRASDRVLVRNRDLRSLWVVAGCSFVALALGLALVQGPLHAAAYVLAIVAMASVYRAMAATGSHRRARSSLVLLKYPAFVLLLAAQPVAMSALVSASLLYIGLAAYEGLEAGEDRAG
jgi:hypothetical protein